MAYRIKIHYLLFFFFLSSYLIVASGTIQSSDGTSMFLVTQSIVENRTFAIKTDRKSLVTKSEIDGNYYSKYGVGQSVFAIPLFAASKIMSYFLDFPTEFLSKFTVSLYNSLVTGATCLILFLFCEKLEFIPRTSVIISFIYGFSTIAWHYSQTFMSEPATTLFVLCAVYYIFKYEKCSKTNLFLSGFFVGLAILTRTSSIIAIPCILFYIFSTCRRRQEEQGYKNVLQDMTLFVFPILIAAILFFYYNYARFGNILETGYRGDFSTNLFLGSYGLLFSSGKGLFVYNPILILSIIGFYFFYKEHKREAILFLLIIFVHLVLYSKWSSWHAGMSWGGRFLLVIIPYLVVTLKYVIESKNNLLKKALIFLTIIGILIQFSSLFVSTSRQYYDLRNQYPGSYTEKIFFSPKYFPIIYQWKNMPKVLKNIFNKDYVDKLLKQAVVGRNFTNSDDKQVLENALVINVPNFWWVYAWIYGIPKWMILSSLMFLVAVILISGKMIFFNHELYY